MSSNIMQHLQQEYEFICNKIDQFDKKISQETNTVIQDYLSVERNTINGIKNHLEDLLGITINSQQPPIIPQVL